MFKLKKWCTDAGDGIELVFNFKNPWIEPTKIDETNSFWVAFKQTIENDLYAFHHL